MNQTDYIHIIETQSPKPESIVPVKKIIDNNIQPSALFIVEQFGRQFIYKISDIKTASRNLILAQSVLTNGVLVPDSKIFIGIGGVHFERYEIIPGQTLAHAIKAQSISETQIYNNILPAVLMADKKISEIHIDKKTILDELVLHDRRKKHNSQDFGKFLANIHYAINKRTTTYGDVKMHHADLNPSNILLDENGKFRALLDLDGIALCDEYTMLLKIITTWPNASTKQVSETYNKITDGEINMHHIQKLKAFNTIKSKLSEKLRNISTHIKNS